MSNHREVLLAAHKAPYRNAAASNRRQSFTDRPGLAAATVAASRNARRSTRTLATTRTLTRRPHGDVQHRVLRTPYRRGEVPHARANQMVGGATPPKRREFSSATHASVARYGWATDVVHCAGGNTQLQEDSTGTPKIAAKRGVLTTPTVAGSVTPGTLLLGAKLFDTRCQLPT